MSEIDKMYEARQKNDENSYEVNRAIDLVQGAIHSEVFDFVVRSKENTKIVSGNVYNYCTSEGNEYYSVGGGRMSGDAPKTISANISESGLNKIRQKGFDKAKELEVADIKIDFVHPERVEGFWKWKTKVVNKSVYYIQISMTLKRR